MLPKDSMNGADFVDTDFVANTNFVGLRIKELCNRQRITKYRLSKLTGITQTVLGNIIKGDSVPTIRTLEKICCALNISLAQFFAKDDSVYDLTPEQLEILETWNGLNSEEREQLMKIVRTFK